MTNNTPHFDFGIRKPENIISSNTRVYPTQNIQIDKLRPFRNHPFKLYEGQRFNDICESIKENGVLLPIIVKPLDDGNYEILSGHNRTAAAKIAGLTTLPAIIRDNLSDDEAMLIVTETNLIQRSFRDLSHSERALILAVHYRTIKHQGKRTDLIKEITDLIQNGENISKNAEFSTYSPVGNKTKSIEKVGREYELSKNSVARYLRVNMLIDSLKNRLDNGEFAIRTAVEISYLKFEQQENLDMVLDSPMYRLDMKKAAQLRECSEKKIMTANDIEEILAGLAKKKRNHAWKVIIVKLKPKMLAKYFAQEQKSEEIETEIFKALDFYRANKLKVMQKSEEDYIEIVEEVEDEE